MILAAIDDHEEFQNGDFLILFLVLSAFSSDDGKTFSHLFFSYPEIVCIGIAIRSLLLSFYL